MPHTVLPQTYSSVNAKCLGPGTELIKKVKSAWPFIRQEKQIQIKIAVKLTGNNISANMLHLLNVIITLFFE